MGNTDLPLDNVVAESSLELDHQGNSSTKEPFSGVRLSFSTSLSFEEVQSRLEKAINAGSFVPGRFTSRFRPAVVSKNRAAVEKVVHEHVGPSGFMTFAIFQHGAWFSLFNSKPPTPRLTAYIIGNPLIAKDLLQHDYTSALFVPFRMIVEEMLDERGRRRGSRVSWDQPSSRLASKVGAKVEDERALLAVAKALDAKIEELVNSITDVETRAHL